MYFRLVDVPDALVQAHKDGELVFFVGAGASRSAPSSLPDFLGLVRGIVEDTHASDLDIGTDSPDTVLGRLEGRGHDVHRLVAERLNPAESEPNDLHRAIVSLASAELPLRIVTTNYDLHLSAVIAEAGLEVSEYRAPALPMGDDFEGLVYLHGALNQEPRHLVVTDRDFGRAYLRDAWAARFLERMYSAYTVVFLGYSLGDVPMRYLARSLSTARNRFAFTDDPEKSDWRSLDIQPIGYERVGNSHQHLVEVVGAWGIDASRGLLDHRQRVRELVTGPPTGVPDDESYLEATVADPVRIRFFTEFADHERWLAWVKRLPTFQRIFDRRAGLEGQEREFAAWFVERYVLREDRTQAALTAVREAGGGLSEGLWWMLGRGLNSLKSRPAWLGPWHVLLIDNSPPVPRDWLEYQLADARLPEDRAAALLLFDHLTQPTANLSGSFGADVNRIEVEVPGSEHWLREAWDEKFAPGLPDIAVDILAIADRHLRRARLLLVTAQGDGKPALDPLSYRRSAIREHEQDAYPESFDVLVDAARDSLVAALTSGESVAIGYLEAWADSDVPLLRRLASHGWACRTDVDASAKATWLLARDWLFDRDVQPEVYDLLRRIAEDLDESTATQLVDSIAQGPDDGDEVDRDRARFDLLTWLFGAAPGLRAGRELLDEIRSRHPEWQPSDHPDVRFVVETGWRRPHPPMGVEDLHALLAEDAAVAITQLQGYEDVPWSVSGTSWEDVEGLVTETVRAHPADGELLLDAAGDWSHALAPAVVRGWSRADLADEDASRILERLLAEDQTGLVDEVADLLASGGQREDTPTEWFRLPRARVLAEAVWNALEQGDLQADVEDWLGRAINHPAGKLAQFWVGAIASDWRQAGESWEGLSEDLKAPLELMLSGTGMATALAEPVVASQLRLLHGADPDWALRYVLPLLDWKSRDRGLRAWHGFLYWGRPTPPLLSAGLLDHYLETVRHVGELPEELHRQLARHLAGIAMWSEPTPDSWVDRFTAAAAEDLRVEWLDAIGWTFRDLPTEEVVAQWGNWLRRYWENRLSSVPVPLTDREASAMARWAPYLGPEISQCVPLVRRSRASLDEDRLLVREIASRDDLLDSQPESVAQLLAHLLVHTTQTLWDCKTLQGVVGRLRGHASEPALRTILEHATRLGCSDAPDW